MQSQQFIFITNTFSKTSIPWQTYYRNANRLIYTEKSQFWNRRLLLGSSGMRKITVSIHWLLQQDSFAALLNKRYLGMCFWNQFRTHFHCNLVLQRIFANYKKFQVFSKTWTPRLRKTGKIWSQPRLWVHIQPLTSVEDTVSKS